MITKEIGLMFREGRYRQVKPSEESVIRAFSDLVGHIFKKHDDDCGIGDKYNDDDEEGIIICQKYCANYEGMEWIDFISYEVSFRWLLGLLRWSMDNTGKGLDSFCFALGEEVR